MKNILSFFTVSSLLIILNCTAVIAQNKTVGIFTAHTDVGGPGVKKGSVTYIPETEQYVISGAGYNVWGDHDEFQYVYKQMTGDFILYARAEFLGNWVDYHRKVGWMIRKSLDGNSPHVNAVEHGDGLTSLQFRRTAGAQTEEHKLPITKANILQLERKGNTYIMRAATYGQLYHRRFYQWHRSRRPGVCRAVRRLSQCRCARNRRIQQCKYQCAGTCLFSALQTISGQ